MVNLRRGCLVVLLVTIFAGVAYSGPLEQRPLTALAVSGAARLAGLGLFAYWLDGPLYTCSGAWSGSYTATTWDMSFVGKANDIELLAESHGTIDYDASTASWTNGWTYQGKTETTTGSADLDFEISDRLKDVAFFGAGIFGEAMGSASITWTGVIAQGVEWATDFLEAGINTTAEMKALNAEQQNLDSQLRVNWTNMEKRKKQRVDRDFASKENSIETNGSGEIQYSWTYSIPEPLTLFLVGFGLAAIGLGRRKGLHKFR